MARFETVRVAAIQATPVILDAEGCIEKAVALLSEAAADGAQLAVLPETFVSLYPSNAWAADAARFGGFDDFWQRMWEQSVDVPGPLVDRLASACKRHKLICAIGVNERESERPGTLYNTLLIIGPEGLLHRHRKLMPTMQERLFHGIGPGDDLAPVDTPVGRIGGLICWENRMPLARWAVYQGGPQIWVAPTADDSDGWLASMRHIAIESGAFVVSAPQYIPRSAFGDDFPVPLRSARCSAAAGGDHRADLRGDRRTAVRRGGDGRRGLRPAGGLARQALVRRRRALLAPGRAELGLERGRDGERLEDHAVTLGQPLERVELLGRGVGVEVEAQPDGLEAHGRGLVHAQR